MADGDFAAGRVPAYGSAEQPLAAERMAPHLRVATAGTGVAVLGVVAAVVGLASFGRFTATGTGEGWAVATVVAAALMLALCVAQVLLWRRTVAGWQGRRPPVPRTAVTVSWVLHLVSYPVALLALLGGMAASAAGAWTTASAVWLTLALVLVIVAQVLAAVQYVRPDGPPGTIPAHLRRLAAWTAEQRRAED